EDYPVTVFLSRGGYFKKITPQCLRMSSEQKYKEDDGPSQSFEAMNNGELLIFTDRQQVYKTRIRDFDDTKASALGTFLPTALKMDDEENVVYMLDPGDYSGQILFVFENGKAARVELSAYATKTNRKKLTGAYSDKSPLRSVIALREETELAVYSTEGRCLVVSSALLSPKATRSTQGVQLMTLKKKYTLDRAMPLAETSVKNVSRYRARAIPAAGALLREEDMEEKQLTLEGMGE
ncbi:MAG: topoisomerase IV, partial [Oscillospiraceae bacterium]|nr:topoisomerase IV [Oscillospiraceae bacterium]